MPILSMQNPTAGTDWSKTARRGRRSLARNGSSPHVEALGDKSGPTLVVTRGWAIDDAIWQQVEASFSYKFGDGAQGSLELSALLDALSQ